MSWKDIKQQAIINELDKLTPGQRKTIIADRYCLVCWQKHTFCDCMEKKDEKNDGNII
jgi:uncharacterized protein (DUF2249 family)